MNIILLLTVLSSCNAFLSTQNRRVSLVNRITITSNSNSQLLAAKDAETDEEIRERLRKKMRKNLYSEKGVAK